MLFNNLVNRVDSQPLPGRTCAPTSHRRSTWLLVRVTIPVERHPGSITVSRADAIMTSHVSLRVAGLLVHLLSGCDRTCCGGFCLFSSLPQLMICAKVQLFGCTFINSRFSWGPPEGAYCGHFRFRLLFNHILF